jgi:hypothetical protein
MASWALPAYRDATINHCQELAHMTDAALESTATQEADSSKSRKGEQPKWEAEARSRLRALIRRLSKPMSDCVARDANEAETRLIVTDVLREGLGYDTYGELAAEYQVKGEFADFGLRIGQQLVAFVEVKRATTNLATKHLRQVEMYAVNEGVEWLILTNGGTWQAYHLTPGMPVRIDLALEVDLLDPDIHVSTKVDGLFYLHKQSLRRRQIDEVWQRRAATSPDQIASVLLSEPVITSVRRELWRETGQRVETDELTRILRTTVLRIDSVGGPSGVP